MESGLKKIAKSMRKTLPGVVLVLIAVVGVGTIISGIIEKRNGPRQSFAIYNSGDKTISVTFHRQKEDKSYGSYIDDISVGPGETKYEQYPRGTYQVNVWDGSFHGESSTKIRSISDLKVVLPKNKSNSNPIYIDAMGTTLFAIVNINFLYSGSQMANSISQSLGTSLERPEIKRLFSGRMPFIIPEKYTRETLVGPSDELPDEISLSETVYALVPVPKTVKTPDDVLECVLRFIKGKMSKAKS